MMKFETYIKNNTESGKPDISQIISYSFKNIEKRGAKFGKI